MNTNNYTISIYTENKLGLLNRVSSIFLKRRINIESLSVTKTDKENTSLFTVEINVSPEKAANTIKQLDKQVEVSHVDCHMNTEDQPLQSQSNL